MLEFLSNYLFYIEQHTALRDALMEFRLAMHCWKNWRADIKKHFVNNVKPVSWQQFNNGLSSVAKMKLRNAKKPTKKTKKVKEKIPFQTDMFGGK